MKTMRVHSEKAIDAAAREAKDRIMRRVSHVILDIEERVTVGDRSEHDRALSKALRELRRAVFRDIGDCVRLQSKFVPRKTK